MVVSLSMMAEMVSPGFAGILSGYPLGAAITLFFIGLELNPSFAAESALYTALGLIATQTFAYGYYRISLITRGMPPAINLISSAAGGIAAYFTAAFLLRALPVNYLTALLFPAIFIFIFNYLFREVESVEINNKVSVDLKLLLIRSIFAASAILLITSTAKIAGPAWAGLFSAFPITMLPLAMIIHFTYDVKHVHAILKNVPRGLISLLVYSLAVYFFYPLYGIYIGTVIAYGFATLGLATIQPAAKR